MAFEPKPGQRIPINGDEVEFTTLESSGGGATFTYAEVGKEATVYLVRKAGKPYALKVFHPNYQDKRLIGNSIKLKQFSNLDGLSVAERDVLTRQTHSKLIATFPELEYAVLMPWVKGNVWGNILTSDKPFAGEKLLQVAKSLIQVVCTLESHGLAHCDLSNNNFIIDLTSYKIELIDIENMFAPDMPRPIPEISYGTPGYRTQWIAENGLWGSNSDRFASAILCAEILTWCFSEIRDRRAGDNSFFNESDIGQANDRYVLMKNCLGSLDFELASLFEKAWFSEQPDRCPSVCEWKIVLDRIEALPSNSDALQKKKI